MWLVLIQYYVFTNLLLLIACALAAAIGVAGEKLRRAISYRQQLQIAYWLVAFSLIAPLAMQFSMPHTFHGAHAQIWAAASSSAPLNQSASGRSATISLTSTGHQFRLQLLTDIICALCIAGVLLALVRLLRSGLDLYRIVANAQCVRRQGRLRILATARSSVPFSFWIPGHCIVVVPMYLVSRRRDLWIAIRHEVQHHRYGDTRLLWVKELLKGIFVLNPGLSILCRKIEELQEYVCDAAVVGQLRGNIQAYCDCLLWVAENTVAQRLPKSCIPMTNSTDRSALARRVDALLQRPKQPLHSLHVIAIQVAGISVLLGVSVLLAGSIQDRRVSWSQAQQMARIARQQTTIRLVVNAQVLEELNRLMGTPDGRQDLRQSLARMQAYRASVSQKLSQSGLPEELLAVPLVESGYRNLLPDGVPGHGAGVWMFIQATARAYRLRVNSVRDDRLSPDSETDAAVEAFSRLHAHFGDWELALLAYNCGAEFVDRALGETGTRDPFKLAQLGYENDPNYLARVIATMIIIKNQRLLDAESS